jgi:drug/metabolite transporter (DMT)-like permease
MPVNPAYGLVVLSAVLHAYWNFLIKRAGGTTVFVGLSKMAEAVVFAPVFAIVLAMHRGDPPVDHAFAALLISVGALLTLSNYLALSAAYSRGDLSVIYPVSRGAGLLFLPLLGFLVFSERLSGMGFAAVAMILIALGLVSGSQGADGRKTSAGAIAYALLAGLAAAGYTVWDKRAIHTLPTFIYFYSYSVIVAIAYGTFLFGHFERSVIEATWRRQWWPITLVGILNTTAYLLVLAALRDGVSTYVIALRQLSIAFGVGLGVWMLKEALPTRKAIGVAVLIAGCAIVAFA